MYIKNTIVKEIITEYNEIRNVSNLNMNYYSKEIGKKDRVINDLIHEIEIDVDENDTFKQIEVMKKLKKATILRRKNKDAMQKTRVFERMKDAVSEQSDFRSQNFSVTAGSGWSFEDIYNAVLILEEKVKKGKKIVTDSKEQGYLDCIFMETNNSFQKLDEIIEIQENRVYEKRVEKNKKEKLYA